jgi:FMN-dependent NADH-azoreductase
MKTEEQIKSEVSRQVIDSIKTTLNEELTQVEKEFEDTYKNKLEQEIQYTLELAESGLPHNSSRTIKVENKKTLQQLDSIRMEKMKVENKLKTLNEFENL